MMLCLVAPSFHDGSGIVRGRAFAAMQSEITAAPSQARLIALHDHRENLLLEVSKRAPRWAPACCTSIARLSLGDRGFDLLLHRLKLNDAPFCIGGNSMAVCASSPTFCCT